VFELLVCLLLLVIAGVSYGVGIFVASAIQRLPLAFVVATITPPVLMCLVFLPFFERYAGAAAFFGSTVAIPASWHGLFTTRERRP
jgi:hypothetical protein